MRKCLHCHKPLERGYRKDGSLERMAPYSGRKFCNINCRSDYTYSQHHRDTLQGIEKRCSGTDTQQSHWVLMTLDNFHVGGSTMRDGFSAYCRPCGSVRWKIYDAARTGRESQASNNTGKQSDQTGFTYIWKQAITSYYKIGFTLNWNKRLKEFQTGNPFDPMMLHLVVNTHPRGLEKKLHRQYIHKKLSNRTEWFQLTRTEYEEIVLTMNQWAESHQPLGTTPKGKIPQKNFTLSS